MAIREKSKEKRNALLKATLNLVNNNGFHDAPMSKIAKMANVSPATIYIYFENKQDLINQLYLELKISYTKQAFKDYSENMPVKKAFEFIWYNIADYKLKQVEEAWFLSQCDNTTMIDEVSVQEGLKHLQPLLDLWERGQKEGIIKDVSPYILYAYAINPLAFLMNMQKRGLYQINQESLEQAFQSAWDSIRI
ncbi:TetR family transcriptional regulator [Labilibaculum manganireducens]|uniref:TetR family transcriptional regulator n=2 Tax=Pseudomonadati TaxID=3379134 RepID=A0A2N3IBL4_9BACT|nr:TetR/AcrR family transcriptional regulator [Labilibaculum manganireducens]PKQ67711.1 TetR family transcriptional regulator [Labilibaculum manganireducens]